MLLPIPSVPFSIPFRTLSAPHGTRGAGPQKRPFPPPRKLAGRFLKSLDSGLENGYKVYNVNGRIIQRDFHLLTPLPPQSPAPPAGEARQTGWLLAILALALALRAWNLGRQNYWFDEAIAVFSARDMAFAIDFERAPPLYFLLLRGWTWCFGESETGTRLLSLVFSVGSVGVLYAMGRRLFSGAVGLWAAFLLALSPFSIYYAQETRPYSLFLFLSLVSSWLLLEHIARRSSAVSSPWLALERFRSRSSLLLYTAVSLLMVYTLYIGVVVMAVHGTVVALCARRRFSRWLLSAAAVGLGFAPWGTVLLRHFSRVQADWWIPSPDWQSLWVSLGTFCLGFNATNWQYAAAGLLAAGIFAAGWDWKSPEKNRVLALWAVAWAAVFAFSRLCSLSIYHDRTLFFALPYLLTCLALCLVSAGRTVKILVLACYLPLAAASLAHYYANELPFRPYRAGIYPRKPVAEAVGVVARGFREGDAVFHTVSTVIFPFKWYALRQTENPALKQFSKTNGFRDFLVSTKDTDAFYLNCRQAAALYPRIWLVQTWWEPNPDFDREREQVLPLLRDQYGYRTVSETQVDTVRISLLSREGACAPPASPLPPPAPIPPPRSR